MKNTESKDSKNDRRRIAVKLPKGYTPATVTYDDTYDVFRDIYTYYPVCTGSGDPVPKEYFINSNILYFPDMQ